MSDEPKKCPFCGCTLTPMLDQLHQKTIAYHHFRIPSTQPGVKCLFNGHSIGVALLPAWNMRHVEDEE